MNAEYPLAVLVSHRCVILRLMGASKTEPAPRHRLQQARDAGVEGQSETLRFAIGLLGLLLWATTMGREASDAVSTLALSCWSGVAGSVESVVSVIDLLVALLGGWVLIVGGLSLSATRWRASKTLAHRFRRISLRAFARRESVAALVGAGGLTLAAIASVVYAGEAWASMLEADAQTLHLWGKEGLQKVLALFVLVLLFAGTAEMLWRRRWLVESTRISRAEARREWRRNGGAPVRRHGQRLARRGGGFVAEGAAELWLVHAADRSAVLVRIIQCGKSEGPPRVIARAGGHEGLRRRSWARYPGVRETYDDEFVAETRGLSLGVPLPSHLLLRVALWRRYDGRDES